MAYRSLVPGQPICAVQVFPSRRELAVPAGGAVAVGRITVLAGGTMTRNRNGRLGPHGVGACCAAIGVYLRCTAGKEAGIRVT